MRILQVFLFVTLAGGVFLYPLTNNSLIINSVIHRTLRPIEWTLPGICWSEKDVVKVLSVTNGGEWGYWHEPVFCPRGSYAVGYRMKIEIYQWDGDDTALNAIRLMCWDRKENILKQLTTEEGPWGNWYDWGYCPMSDGPGPFTLLTAFTLKVEPNQGGLDDTAANGVQFLCKTLDSSEVLDPATSKMATHNGEGPFGSYGPWSSSCPLYSAICGLRTKIENEQGNGDDTSLNDVEFYCCRSSESLPSLTGNSLIGNSLIGNSIIGK